jgi:hypothetical protein
MHHTAYPITPRTGPFLALFTLRMLPVLQRQRQRQPSVPWTMLSYPCSLRCYARRCVIARRLAGACVGSSHGDSSIPRKPLHTLALASHFSPGFCCGSGEIGDDLKWNSTKDKQDTSNDPVAAIPTKFLRQIPKRRCPSIPTKHSGATSVQ